MPGWKTLRIAETPSLSLQGYLAHERWFLGWCFVENYTPFTLKLQRGNEQRWWAIASSAWTRVYVAESGTTMLLPTELGDRISTLELCRISRVTKEDIKPPRTPFFPLFMGSLIWIHRSPWEDLVSLKFDLCHHHSPTHGMGSNDIPSGVFAVCICLRWYVKIPHSVVQTRNFFRMVLELKGGGHPEGLLPGLYAVTYAVFMWWKESEAWFLFHSVRSLI